MKEIKETTYKGTRILLGNEKRFIINAMCKFLIKCGWVRQIDNYNLKIYGLFNV